MEVEDRQNLRKNRVALANDLDITQVLQTLVGKGILNDEMVERINSKTTVYQRNVEFLNILPRRGPRAFKQFCLALQDTDHFHLFELLEPSTSSNIHSNLTNFHRENVSDFGHTTQQPTHNLTSLITKPKSLFDPDSSIYSTLPNANSTTIQQSGYLNAILSNQTVNCEIVPSPNSMDDLLSTTSFETLSQEADLKNAGSKKNQQQVIEGIDITDNPTVNDLCVRPSNYKFREKHYMNAYSMISPPQRLALIINVTKFDESTLLENRQAGDVDKARLEYVLRQLGFRVYVLENGTALEIRMTIQKFSALEDLAVCDSAMLFVMSHGVSGAFYGRDGNTVEIEYIFDLFSNENCRVLQHKPKGFFFQCCRGNVPDKGVDETDGKFQQDSIPYIEQRSSNVPINREYVFNQNPCNKLPSRSDFLIAYATVDGYSAMRNTKQGSWFIQALVRVLAFHACNRDLHEMMTIVNNLVSQREGYSPDSEYHRCKEMSEVQSTLRRKWYFYPGM